MGIGIALFIERYGFKSKIRGPGLGGAIAINICGALALLIWLLINPFDLPLKGYIILWIIPLGVLVADIEKFPDDFMFKLINDGFNNLKSQIATSSSGWGGRGKPPLIFTEQGALHAANVLNSEQANKMSVFIARALVRLREEADKRTGRFTEI